MQRQTTNHPSTTLQKHLPPHENELSDFYSGEEQLDVCTTNDCECAKDLLPLEGGHVGEDMFHWQATIHFPPDYPFKPPKDIENGAYAEDATRTKAGTIEYLMEVEERRSCQGAMMPVERLVIRPETNME